MDGALLSNNWRDSDAIKTMNQEDKRNVIIVELGKLTTNVQLLRLVNQGKKFILLPWDFGTETLWNETFGNLPKLTKDLIKIIKPTTWHKKSPHIAQ